MADHDFSIRTAALAVAATVIGGATTGYFGYLSGRAQADSQRAAKCAEAISEREKSLRDRAERLLVAYATLQAKVSETGTQISLSDWRAVATPVEIAAYTLAAQSDEELADASYALASDLQAHVLSSAVDTPTAVQRRTPEETRKNLREAARQWRKAFSSQIRTFDDARNQCRAGA